MRLPGGVLWPIPVNLDVTEEFAAGVKPGDRIALRNAEGVLIATLELSDLWRPDRSAEARAVYRHDGPGPSWRRLPARAFEPGLSRRQAPRRQSPPHYDFRALRHTPAELREHFRKRGWRRVVAFQTRNPLHRAHQELTFRAAREHEANLLIHPVVGMTKPGDVDHYTRVRCYEAVLREYPEQTTALSLLNLAMRMAGPREALWHAIIRKNHGCTHFIVGRDHAGPGNDSSGKPFYGPYDAQELLKEHERELDISMVPFQEMVYVEDLGQYLPIDETAPGQKVLNISGTELRRRLQEGLDIPEWFSYPDVVTQLRKAYPPRHRQGFTVFFTGLSGSGKSTIANALIAKLMEIGTRRITLLDGDLVRKNLSSELGFSREHRDLNIHRIGYVAYEVTKHGGAAMCAPIAPYAGARGKVRELIEPLGGFVEVFVDTPIEVCEQRDRKGPLREGARGPDQGIHRDIGPLRGAAEPGGAYRHR